MADKLKVLGLMFSAKHGVWLEEKTLDQPFEVDVEIERDFSEASRTDKLEDTVDYPAVVSVVKDVIHGDHCKLIERLAGKILDRLESIVRTGIITVRIRKPRAPVGLPFRTIEIELKRELK